MDKAYQKSIENIYKILNTSSNGLNSIEAKKRLKTYGPNILIDKNKRTKLQIFLSQFKNMMINRHHKISGKSPGSWINTLLSPSQR